MEDFPVPRFQLMDEEELRDMVDSASSKNTKSTVKYTVKIFEDFLQTVNTDLDRVGRLSNAELDKILQKFYAGCRQKNGDYYSKKSMLSIRFGIQRHFLNTKSVDIVKHEDFAKSSRIFKCFSATLKQQGKGFVKHKSPISPEDMAKIQASLDLESPQGLQDKVFMDVMLYFCNRGRENLREMTVDSFDICEDEGNCYIALKDTLTKNNREDKLEKSQCGIMTPTNGPRCPVASFLLYKSKLNPECKSFWQRPKLKWSDGTWYCNASQGKNIIGDKMKNISSRAGTKVYTNHCLRATSITALQNGGFRDREIMTVSGHRSESSLKHYVSTSNQTKESMSRCLASAINPGVPNSAPSTSGTKENMGHAIAKSESQEIRELEEILNDMSNQIGQNQPTGTCNITSTTTMDTHLSSHRAPTFNIQNCVVHIHNQ